MAILRRYSSPLKDYPKKSISSVTIAIHRWVEERGYCAPDADMKAVAKDLGISKDRLSAYCLTVIGKSFLTWRKELRIAETQRLMKEYPRMTMAMLAESVGLDRSNFRKHLNEVCGCSPQEWREKHLYNK